jgi:hypothetical protein
MSEREPHRKVWVFTKRNAENRESHRKELRKLFEKIFY